MSYQICSRCISDTTIPSIRFDEKGICNFCHSHDQLALTYPDDQRREENRRQLVETIKAAGKNKQYDCIVGVSGGTDSSYTLYQAKELGLRPLAVHFDNGWNSEHAVMNIKRLTDKLGVDFCTYVVDWEEFRDLQRSFLFASVPCIEAPTDVAIHAVLYKMAKQEQVKYILGGQSFKTEGTVPREWSYLDGTYIRSVHGKYGTVPLKSYPNLSLFSVFNYTFVHGIRQIPFLNYFDYSKQMAKTVLGTQFGWTDYGGHHYENVYSRFAFGWYQYRKFGIDKRIISLSGPVRSGHLSRESALELIASPPPVDDEVLEYCLNKLCLTHQQWDQIMRAPKRTYRDFFTSEKIITKFRWPMKVAVKMNFFTPVLYEKYFE